MVQKIYFIFVFLLATACVKQHSSKKTDHFFISNDGAIMPVFVSGNFNSDVIILFLHGGPGGNATQATYIPAFNTLEENYSIAYWDQRGSGLSQGNPDKETFTIEQFVEDTYLVIKALEKRFHGKKIFLFGHSWGGALGAAFLSSKDYQSNIFGFICMDSGHNLELGLPLSLNWVKNYAAEQIDLGTNLILWKEVLTWCTSNPDMTSPENYFKYVEYLNKTDAYRHDNKEVIINNVTIGDVLNSRLSLSLLLGGYYLSQNFNILKLNLSEQMQSINIPSLVIWGKHDGVNTIDMAYDAYNSLGTSNLKKEFVILDSSAHEGYLEQPATFVSSMTSFIEKYK